MLPTNYLCLIHFLFILVLRTYSNSTIDYEPILSLITVNSQHENNTIGVHNLYTNSNQEPLSELFSSSFYLSVTKIVSNPIKILTYQIPDEEKWYVHSFHYDRNNW